MYKWVLFAVLLLFVADVILVFFVKKHNIVLENRYYNWHKKIGFFKFSVLKAAYVLWLSYDLIDPPGNAGAVWVAAIVYCYAVLALIVAFIKSFFRGRTKGSHLKN
jgi:hypothetical protein